MKKEQIDVRQLLEDPAKGREFIRKGLELDLKCAIFTLNQVYSSSELMEAFVETQWRRYVAFYEKEKAQGKLFTDEPKLNGNG